MIIEGACIALYTTATVLTVVGGTREIYEINQETKRIRKRKEEKRQIIGQLLEKLHHKLVKEGKMVL